MKIDQKAIKQWQQWLDSPKGQAAMKKAIKESINIIKKLKNDRKLTDEELNRKFDI